VRSEKSTTVSVMAISPGRSFAQVQQGYPGEIAMTETVVLFSDLTGRASGSWRSIQDGDSTVAHEILHLFGAEDYYAEGGEREGRENLALSGGSAQDIMLVMSRDLDVLRVTAPTAYCVGWTDQCPSVMTDPDWSR